MLLTPSIKLRDLVKANENEIHILSNCCTEYSHYINCLVCKADRDDAG